jgi:hypothetical protein
MRGLRLIAVLVFLLAPKFLPAQECKSTVNGNLKILAFQSKVFPTPRNLRILLPTGYDLPENRNLRYPVVYLNDGQNLFDVCTSVFEKEEWQVDETAVGLITAKKIPAIIVVGIDNAGRQLRAKEYLPFVDETLSPPEPNPEGHLYPQFLLDEVVPFVEHSFRVLPGARHRVLGGSSYGAGIALFTVISFTYLITATLRKLPQDISNHPDSFIPNPLHLLPAVIFLIAMIGYRRRRYLSDSAFDRSIYIAVWLNLAAQLAACQSVRLLDGPFVFAQGLNVCCYFILLGGALLDSAHVFEQVRHLAASDPLTGLANYRRAMSAVWR